MMHIFVVGIEQIRIYLITEVNNNNKNDERRVYSKINNNNNIGGLRP